MQLSDDKIVIDGGAYKGDTYNDFINLVKSYNHYYFCELFEIPLLIHKMNPNYKLYLRHYGVEINDTICYAT